MDVNSVLQNTRQYFQGIPSSSPASGELAPGASVGYSSPPVSSTATSVAPSSNYPPYAGSHFGQNNWSTPPNSSQNAYHQPSTGSATNGQPRFTQAVASAPYHYYDNARSQKALPSTSNSAYGAQHNYTTPSITRLKEGGVNNQGMFNMDSIVCQQPNANYAPSKKSKIKSSQSASSSANVYRQPTQLEESRYFNSHHASQPSAHPMQSGSTTATRVPAVMPHASVPSHHLQRPPEPANHQSYAGHQSVIEQRVGFQQQQVSYHHSSSAVSVRGPLPQEKAATQREPVDARYYVNRRLEATALQSPAVKRDSPLDLSVKTIRQSADSTAHDDPENSMYNHHLQNAGYSIAPHMRPVEGRHSHLPPQLPYANLATAAVTLPNVHNHSSNSAFSAIQRQPHYPPVNAPVYPPEAPSPYRVSNGQLVPVEDAALRHPVSEYRNEKMTFSFTYEQKQQMHRTQVNAQVSTVRFSQYYQPNDAAKPKNNGQPTSQPYLPDKSFASPSPQPKLPSNGTSRKRRAIPETPTAPVKNPRVSLEWRENIDKEIENRLNACIKAREQEERASKSTHVESYREPPQVPSNADSVLRSNLEKERDLHTKLPFTQYLEQHKAQHKLPVQPIHPHPHHQWYRQPNAQQYPNMQPYKPAMSPRPPEHRVVYQDNHVVKFNETNFEQRDLKIIEKVENKHLETLEQRPLPPFRAFSMQPSSPYSPSHHERDTKVLIERRSETDTPPASGSADEDSQSRAALMASALAHPRIRTKAELKQVTPMNKSKDKTSSETPANKLPETQNAKKVSRSQADSEIAKSHSNTKAFSISESRHSGDSVLNHRPAKAENTSKSPQSPPYMGMDLAKQSLPRKRLLSRSEEHGIRVHRSSSETTVFDFRSDSEPENTSADLHSLNDMRKDRIKTRTPSVTPTNIDQMNEVFSDDSQWLEACDELIQQFSNTGSQKKRTPKKASPRKPNEVQTTATIKKPSPPDNDKDDDTKDSVELPKPVADKIKTESIDDAYDTPVVAAKQLAAVRVKKELFSDTEEDEDDDEDDDDDEEDDDDDEDYEDDEEKRKRAKQETKDKNKVNATLEIRGQRSNVSATRIRIQNSLEDSSSDSEEDFKPKKAPVSKPKSKVLIKKKKIPTKSKVIARKKAKSKNIDPKREKMRHMILRRMETRKSKLDAKKAAKKARSESVDDQPAPMMTRKMLRRECQKDLKSKPDDRKKKSAVSAKTKIDDKSKKSDKSDDKTRPKLDRQSKEDKNKPKNEDIKVKPSEEKLKSKSKDDKSKSKDKPNEEPNKTKDHKANDEKPKTKSERQDDKSKTPKKDDKNKKSDKSNKKPEPKSETKDKEPEDVTRSLRSRNVVVNEHASPAKKPLPPKKCESPKEKSKSPAKPIKKEPKNEDKKKSASKEKLDMKPSWEEELFNYKYSLRMPVKLINIAKPQNWPKSNGGASSLPDLDRSESDSDLLNDCTKPKTPKKKNKDETKVSNTKEFKDSVKILKEKFDKKIEEKNKATSLTQLMIEKKIKTIPKSSDGPELLPTPSLDSFRSKLNNKTDSPKKNDSKKTKDSTKNEDDDKDEIVEDSLIGYFRKETVDVFKEVFEKHQVPNQFKTVILESRTRTQTKEMKHNATLKQVFGCDRPASAPPVTDSMDDDKKLKNSTNGCLKPWQKSFAKFKLLMEENCDAQNEKNSKDFEETVDFVYNGEDTKDNIEIDNAVKKKTRTFRRKCRSSGFDYIRKKKKIKKEEDEETLEEKERKKAAAPIRPNAESIEDIQNEIRSWVVNKGIGETVLHKAARLGYSDISSYCLEKLNVSPSPTDNAGYTPLHEACTRGHLKIAKMLLKYGAEVSASAKGGIRPLHEAVEHGNIELVRLLLAYGADPLLSTYAGQTPLSLIKEDQDDLKDFLLLYLADIQGTPSKPWPFLGYDKIDPELNGYDPLRDSPPPSPEQATNLEIEMSDTPLPNLYRMKNDPDLWVLCSDLPAKLRDSITKRAQDQTPSQYMIKKLSRTEFDENVECTSYLENKFSQKHKSRPTSYTMIKYNDKLIAALNVQKVAMTFS